MSVTLDKKNLIKSLKQSFIVDSTNQLIIERGINNNYIDDIYGYFQIPVEQLFDILVFGLSERAIREKN